MGWTGRAPAPDGTQSARGACQEKEHYHASRSHRSHSDRHRNRYGQEHTSHDWPRSARRHRVAREGLTRTHYIEACELATLSHWHRSGNGDAPRCRELAVLGHDVKQVPPAYAKPFWLGHKNDFRDAHAVAEAVISSGARHHRPTRTALLTFWLRLLPTS